jgi:putative nucleotidyltransferase with HDIG domain
VGGLVAELGHYIARFFGFFRLRPLRPREQDEVRRALSPAEAALFFAMQPEDQRHSHTMAMRVAAALPGDDVAVRAALLHDVGKGHRRIGVIGRSVATVLGHLGMPMTDAMRSYWDHATIGAEDLRAVGSDGFVVEFAAHHPGGPPSWATDPRWPILIDADT